MEKQEIRSIAEKVINRLIHTRRDDGSNDHLVIDQWEWPQGVAMYSLYKYYRDTGDKKYLDFMVSWYGKRFAEGLPERNVNTTAPMLALAFLWEETGNDEYRALCENWAEWVMKEMPRTEEGGLQHITTHDVNFQQIWDDTLFMTVLFLGKAGKILRREDMVQEAVRQFLLHIKYLADDKTGLWFHGWTFDGRHHFGEALWARGNCWYTAASVEFIEIVEPGEGVRRIIADTLETQVRKLAELQDAGGLWHTLLDCPDSYLETSAASGFAYGILKAVRLKLIGEMYLDCGRKAADGVMKNIAPDGTVLQVSYGTAMGMDKDHYRRIAICPTAYGQGLTFLMMTEVLKIK